MVADDIDKKGASLLGRREEPEFWQHLALEGRRKTPSFPEKQSPTIIREKEIIREIVLIPCVYCSGLMPQSAIFCPNCGERRKADKSIIVRFFYLGFIKSLYILLHFERCK